MVLVWVEKIKYSVAFGLVLVACGYASQTLAQTVAPKPAPTLVRPKVAVRDILKSCFECHGDGGISQVSARPTIAGQKSNYLARELKAFQQAALKPAGGPDKNVDKATGKENKSRAMLRANPVMQHMVKGLDFASISKISAALSKMACRKEETKVSPKSAPAIARRCISCHGKTGMARQRDTPHLAGQQRSYLRRQLLLIREAAWGAIPREGEGLRSHPIMESKVARLTIQDVDALAEFYSSQDCKGPGAK